MKRAARHPANRSLRARWIYAAKPKSWPKLLVPFLLGQALGTTRAGIDVAAFALGLAFTCALLLFIVFLNDWADREVDTIKRRRFPNGSSPKTIPDRVLPAYQLLIVGAMCGAVALLIALLAGTALGRDRAFLSAIGALSIFVVYSLPPFRLNYRGGGELLEMLGVGAALPLLMAYLQSGEVLGLPGLWLVPGSCAFALGSAVASGLSDERSDRVGGKRTIVTILGNRLARRLVELSVLVGVVLWLAGAWRAPLPSWIAWGPASIVALGALRAVRLSPRARRDAPRELGRYKAALHGAVWRGAVALAMLLAWWQTR